MLLGWLTFASATIAAVLQGRKAAQGWIYDRQGLPSADQADRLRRYLEEYDFLSRNPTPDELDVLEKATTESRTAAFRRAHRIRGLNWGGRPPGAPSL